MVPVLAQLVAPPLQNSPVRLPGPDTQEQRLPRQQEQPALDPRIEDAAPEGASQDPDLAPEAPAEQPRPSPGASVPPQGLPRITGLDRYSQEQLRRILAPCTDIPDPQQRIERCAAALTAQLVADGYVNTRVYVTSLEDQGSLEVIEGRVAELEIRGSDDRLNARVGRLLDGLQGRVLHLPTLERDLRLLRRLPEVDSVRANLSKLGSDPALAVLRVQVEPRDQPWRGEVSLRNDGSDGSGEFRATSALVKGDLISRGDTLFLYGELNADDQPDLGYGIGSISYTYPLSDTLNLTGAFGYSRRELIELPSPADDLATSQYQGLVQLEWVFHESLTQRWGVFLGFSGNRSNTSLDNAALPGELPETVRKPQSGSLRFGVSGFGLSGPVAWSGNAYVLQGIAATVPSKQRRELSAVDIRPSDATALGGLVSASWGVAPNLQLNFSAGGQVALNPLLSPMRFTLGSDVGLRGLPAQLVSGDSGWLGTTEAVFTAWRKEEQAIQIVPFFGAGGVRTELAGLDFDDTVGSGGVLVRYVNAAWLLELGWVDSFETEDNFSVWQDWLIGDGLYARLQYRF